MKFRTWNVKEQKYYPWQLLDDDSNVIADLWKLLNYPDGPEWIVEQFSECVDRNGLEIYSGDKVRCLSENGEGTVYFKNGAFMTDCEGWGDQILSEINEDDIEITGNIHEAGKESK